MPGWGALGEADTASSADLYTDQAPPLDSYLRGYLRQGKPCYLTGDASAAALWAARGLRARPFSQVIVEAAPNALALRRRLLRALRTQLQIERLHAGQSPAALVPRLPRHPPRWQGQGLGAQLPRGPIPPQSSPEPAK